VRDAEVKPVRLKGPNGNVVETTESDQMEFLKSKGYVAVEQ